MSFIDDMKNKHTVSVPRNYLEMLEDFYQNNKDSDFNISGRVMQVVHTNLQTEITLFLDENKVTEKDFKTIVILDDEGRQKGKFHRV